MNQEFFFRTAGRYLVQSLRLTLCVVALCILQDCGCGADTESTRCVELRASLRIQGLANRQVRIWVPVPQSSSFQTATQMVRHASLPLKITTEQHYGNQMLFGEGTIIDPEGLDFEFLWTVCRRQAGSDVSARGGVLPDAERTIWLEGSPKIPIGGKPVELIDASKLPEEPCDKARLFYDRVLDHMRYDKSRPGYGTGDAVWACDSRFGNCTDFHSLFMSLARSHDIPARFEIGYPLMPDKVQGEIRGYHCWAWFHDEKQGWVPVDISEADKRPELTEYYFGNLSVHRIAFSVGRNIELEPSQQGPALNYFVKPYVEVDGRPVEDSHVEFSLSFQNIGVGELD